MHFGGDIVAFLLSFFLSVYFFNDGNYLELEWVILFIIISIWGIIMYWGKLYELNIRHKLSLAAVNYIKAYIILIVSLILCFSLFQFSEPSKNIIIGFVVTLAVVGIPLNFLFLRISEFRSMNSRKKYTLVAGIGNLAVNVEKNLKSLHSSSHEIKGFVKCKNEECIVGQERVVGNLDNINDYLKDNPVDEIVIAIPVKPSKKVRSIIQAADYHGVRVKYIPDYSGLLGENYKIMRYGQIDAVNVRQLPLDNTQSFLIKNVFDKIFAAAALLGLAPLFLILAVLIKFDSPGPVFYCPIRVGKGGKLFKVFKFRSMHGTDASSGGVLSTSKNDPRVTRIGNVLRKYSLDELPQFLNVLLGDMSVVGPRPHRSYLNQQLQASVDKYMIRHYFKPGITGWAQVNGWRGPTETKEQKNQRTIHDLWYMENWSFWLDIKIIGRTIFSRNTHKSAF